MPGVRVGHWTDKAARTGCTVVLFPEGTVASGEVRGGAPATREFALLEPHRLVSRLDAVVLCGGSAFGLAAADGVMAFCEASGCGFPTGAGPVPIAVAMALFDLTVGIGSVRPTADEGRAAAESATDGPFATGQVGAGTGARVDKWRGAEHAKPAGIGTATARDGDLVVSALMAVNAFGAVTSDDVGELPPPGVAEPFEHTTIGVVATNADLDKVGCLLLAQAGHDGLARAVRPSHTRFDGDAIVAAAVGGVETEVHLVQLLAARAVEEAVRSSLTA
ncbi:MAG: P1 family peptidase [Actinomycetota bacterium]